MLLTAIHRCSKWLLCGFSLFLLSMNVNAAAVNIKAKPPAAPAEQITIYAEPNQTSAVVEKMSSNSAIITIFQPKNSDWIKVANPQNGNTGWVKSKDLSQASFNVQMIQGESGPEHYQVIQYGNIPVNSQSVANIMEQMRKRQSVIQQEMQQSVDTMYKEMQLFWSHFPMTLPVLVITPANQPAPVKPQATTQTAPTATTDTLKKPH